MLAPIQFAGPNVRYTQCAKCRTLYKLGSDSFDEGTHLNCKGCGERLRLAKMSNVEWAELCDLYPQPLSPVMAVIVPSHDGTDAYVCCDCVACKAWRRRDANKITPSKMPMWECPAVRDSAEADAAQALFVEYGVPVNSLIANVGYGTSLVIALRKMNAAMRISSEPLKQQGIDAMINHSLAAVSVLYKVPVSRLLGSPSTAEAENEIRAYHVELAMDASQRNEKLKQELIRQYTNLAAYKLGASATLGVDSDRQKRKQKEIKDYLATCLVLIGCSYTEAGEIISELVEGLKNV